MTFAASTSGRHATPDQPLADPNDSLTSRVGAWQLWCDEHGGSSSRPLPPSLREKALTAFSNSPVHPSVFQEEVAKVLGQLDLTLEHEARWPHA